ncbi:hypothetical protein PSTEL_26595 [Paenibacillus stellifer]|uniref:Uncharacterized protein n=2 Tax=Paenibacillus stellifer TaxID=169760 RepID=A0A089LX91_9BACL|nr:hypothetical protein PSTEL_26595 [Paenibacillus stellifer]
MTEYTPKDEVALIEKIRQNKDSSKELYETYRDLTVIDIHNHVPPIRLPFRGRGKSTESTVSFCSEIFRSRARSTPIN